MTDVSRARLLGLLGILVLAAAVGAVATRASAPGPREPARASAAPGSAGRIAVEPKSFDFGRLACKKQPCEVEREFVVRNYGAGDLQIEGVSTSCGCTVADGWDTVVKPGGRTVVRVILSTRNLSGAIAKSVIIRSSDPENPSVELVLKATVEAPAAPVS